MMGKWQALLLLVLCSFLLGCTDENEMKQLKSDEQQVELFVSAAASLTDVMLELKEMYETNHDGHITFNFAGSGKLTQQIQQGAPVDIIISANEFWMDTLIDENLVKKDSKIEVTGNRLVLITNEQSNLTYSSFDELDSEQLGDIAIGKPESVPAGRYTKEVLRALDLWEEFEPNFIYAQDVRQVLTYVESENVDIGFVYESDALISEKVKVLAIADASLHESILYPAAITKDSQHSKEAEEFLLFLLSDEAQEVLGTYGFQKSN